MELTFAQIERLAKIITDEARAQNISRCDIDTTLKIEIKPPLLMITGPERVSMWQWNAGTGTWRKVRSPFSVLLT